MKNILIYTIVLLFLGSSLAHAQKMTKEEKRAFRKQTRSLLKKAKVAIEEGHLDQAYIDLDSLLEIDSKNADAYYFKGWIELQNADSVSAEATLTAGITAAPLSTRLKILTARLFIAQNKIAEAAEHLDQILKIKPREAETLYLRGMTFLHQNDTTQALDYLKRGLENALAKGH